MEEKERVLKYDGMNKFQSSCFIILENKQEIGYAELIKDFGEHRNLTYSELVEWCATSPCNVVCTLFKS